MEGNFAYSFRGERHQELSLAVDDTGFRTCLPDEGWGIGVQDHYVLYYVASGGGRVETGGRTFVLEPGDAFLARPEVPFSLRAHRDGPWGYYWVGFSGPAAELLLERTAFSPQMPVVRVERGEELRRGFADIYSARGTDYASAVRMGGYLQAALGLLMESPSGSGRSGGLARYARQGAAFLRRNHSRPIGVEEAAAAAGVSRSCLYRAFRQELGCSPSDYLTRCRIHRAQELLRQSDLPVGAVAASVGFEDPFYFSRAFRREVGSSPTQYRAKWKEV